MKKILLTMNAAFFAMTVVAQNSIIENLDFSTDLGASFSAVTAIDVNNDGRCDIVYAGVGNHVTNTKGGDDNTKKRVTHVMLNNGGGEWEPVGFYSPTFQDRVGFNLGERPSISPCDINGDGVMDLVVFETAGLAYNNQPFYDNISQEGIFIGQGDGTFMRFQPTIIENDGTLNETFDMRKFLTGEVADVNNDGLLDIIAISYHKSMSSVARNHPTYNCVLINEGKGVFRRTNFFSDPYVEDYGQNGKEYHFDEAFVETCDFNCDGYIDFIILARSNDRAAMGVSNGSNTHYTNIFLNDPEHPGQFRTLKIYEPEMGDAIPLVSDGGVSIADFTGDGIPDIFISAWTDNNRGSYLWGLYQGNIADNGIPYYTSMGKCGLSEMRNQSSVRGQYGAFDWNADGVFDIINMGWSTALSTQTSFIGINDGTGKFTEQYRAGAGSEGAMTFLDWNGDGTIDFVNAGRSGDQTCLPITGFTNIFNVAGNTFHAPARPDAPVDVKYEQLADGRVKISWSDAPTVKKNVTYEYYAQMTNVNTPVLLGTGNVFVGGDNDGLRKVVQPGNAFNSRSVTLSLPNGTYTFGVQTVDACYQGSKFATIELTVSGSSVQFKTPSFQPKRALYPRSGKTYTNPVIDRSVPDPTVLRDDDGTYYLIGTEDVHNCPLYKSEDLVHWDFVGTAFSDNTRPTMVPNGGIWAPDLNKFDNGRYYLYFSKSTWGGTWECGIGVAYASKPTGPYRGAKKLFISSEIGVENSIDPFFIEEDGKKYLFWGSFHDIYGIQLSDDGMSVLPEAEKVKVAGGIMEGTYIIKHDGYYYLIGSAGSCCAGANSTYHLLVARSEELFGPYLDKFGKTAYGDNMSHLLYANDAVIGPGHCSEWVQDDAGDYWMLYHGYDAADVEGNRKVFLEKVEWDVDGWPYFVGQGPSKEAEAPYIGPLSAIKTIGGDETQKDNVASVYPKRVSNQLTIKSLSNSKLSYTIRNTHGQTMKRGSGKEKCEVNMYDVREGMYLVTVKTPYGTQTEKIIKK